jgi:hypothetical protein
MPEHAHLANPAPSSLLSDASCVPHPGAGLVARWGDVFLVVADAHLAVANLLLSHCAGVAEAGGDGRMLSRRLAGFLTTYDEEVPAFAAAAPVADGLAVFVQGAAYVVVSDGSTVSGAESLSWVDRLIPWPVTTLTISAGPATEPVRGPYDLQRGVVPGAGLTLSRSISEPSPESPGEAVIEVPVDEDGPQETPADVLSPTSSDRLASPPPDRWPGQGHEVPAFESVVIDLDSPEADDEAPRSPLPVAAESARAQSESPTGSVVRGVYCKNGHFDDPRVLFCAVCGINMVQQTPVLTEGPRPPLGVLLLDDGSAFQLDADYVLGREPMHDPDVRTGRLRGIVLSDDNKSVSRAHARIELRQWDVVLTDNSSSNGTYVAAEGDESWTPLQAGKPRILTSGIRIRLGSRTLAFNSFRGE